MVTTMRADQSSLDGWLSRSCQLHSADTSEGKDAGGLRFAFLGRASTTEYQDPVTSRAWQREAAENVIAGHGAIVAEYFDVGCSRQVPWGQRPQAGTLLAALACPDRGFDAVVVGEYERAFDAGQLNALLPAFERHGVQVWLPETGGPVDAGSPMHQTLMTVLGAQSHREVLRAKHRVAAAMRTQAVEQGRYFGGRPPYGYRLVDAGRHPNRAHARWGRRLQKLVPDPGTARHVRWIFAQRIAASIARELNESGVPNPSGSDPVRNPHHGGQAWSLRTVIEILENPRYTGRQVRNRTCTDRSQPSSSGRRRSVRNPMSQWAVSATVTHEALVSERDFVAVQHARVARTSAAGEVRTYQLAGLLRCGLCTRRMDSHWVHSRPGYRCRHGHRSDRTRPAAPKTLYWREDRLLTQIMAQWTSYGPVATLAVGQIIQLMRTAGVTVVFGPASIALHRDHEPDTTAPTIISG